jgi:nucleotidyltransferase substrate binding protein (TIGR01987 family)
VERLKERLETARKALASLEAILREPKTEIARDAAIQRFEYTFEAVWKAAQAYMRDREGNDCGSPKSAARMSFQTELLTEAQARLAIEMADDRNLTVHTYNEALAETIYSRLPAYAALMHSWLTAMDA